MCCSQFKSGARFCICSPAWTSFSATRALTIDLAPDAWVGGLWSCSCYQNASDPSPLPTCDCYPSLFCIPPTEVQQDIISGSTLPSSWVAMAWTKVTMRGSTMIIIVMIYCTVMVYSRSFPLNGNILALDVEEPLIKRLFEDHIGDEDTNSGKRLFTWVLESLLNFILFYSGFKKRFHVLILPLHQSVEL